MEPIMSSRGLRRAMRRPQGSTLLVLAAVFVAGVPTTWAQTKPPVPVRGQVRGEEPQPETFFYDTVIDGRLTGGMISIDLADAHRRAQFGAQLPPGYRMPTWPVTTLRNNGPSDNRIDLVLLGDGYTAAALGQYANHVDAIIPSFFAQEPLAAYAPYFNVHRVDVTSAELGVDELDRGIFRDTALDMAFGCFGVPRALCVNLAKATAAALSAPAADQVLAVANSTRYGGAGYPARDIGTVSGNNSAALEIALHEFGHSLADLHDEYDYGGSGTYSGPEFAHANVSIYNAVELQNQQWKWFRWLDLLNVDAFPGGATYEAGVFRPTQDSKMRNLGRPFEEVNVERFVMSIYEIVSPVDDATPVSAAPRAACNSLFVTPLQPADHSLTIRWAINGTIIPGATSGSFTPIHHPLPPGISTVRVTVTDETPRVRDESFRQQYMTFSREWDVRDSGTPGACVCDAAAAPQEAPEWLPSNRYLSFVPRPGAIRVRLLSLMRPRPPALIGASPPDYSALEGQVRWVGPPQLVLESNGAPGSFFAAKLQCEPFYYDWSVIPVVHVTGPEVVPSSRYVVQVVDEGCDDTAETSYSPAVLLTTARWGDVVPPFQNPSALFATQPDIVDVAAMVNRVMERPGALPRVRTQLQPADFALTAPVGILDVTACSSAVQGLAFPFPPPPSCE